MNLLPGMEMAIKASYANRIHSLIKEMAALGIDNRQEGKRNDNSKRLHLGTTSLMEADIDALEAYIQHLRRRRDEGQN